jgi:heme/copper-type cytochrome/quinol oxidase subunit 2
MKFLTRSAFLSALALTSVAALFYFGVVLYAREVVGPNMGRGPSVSEEVSRIMHRLLIVEAYVLGALAILLTAMIWWVRTARAPELLHKGSYRKALQISLLAIPLTLAITLSLFGYWSL